MTPRRLTHWLGGRVWSLGLIFSTVVFIFALSANHRQTNHLKAILTRIDIDTAHSQLAACYQRQESRDEIRSIVALTKSSPLLTPETSLLWNNIYKDLPVIDCSLHVYAVYAVETAHPVLSQTKGFFMSSWSPERVTAFLATLIPIITTLLAYVGPGAKDRFTAAITGALAFVAGPVATLIQSNHALISWVSARNVGFAWVIAGVSYIIAWKPIFKINQTIGKYGLQLGKPAPV
jgi:hypothetical protein